MSITIPYSPIGAHDDYSLFQSFIKDFLVELRKKAISKGSKEKDLWPITAIEMRYLWVGPSDKIYELDEIASVVGKSRERVRQVLLAFSTKVKRIIGDGEVIDGISSTDEAKDVYKKFVADLKPIENITILKHKFGFNEQDEKTLLCLLDALDYDCSKRKDMDEQYAISPKQFELSLGSLFKKASILKKFFNDNPVSKSFQKEVKSFFVKQRWSNEECSSMEAFLKSDEHEYEWSSPDALGNNWISLRWEALSGEDKRIERILYEFAQNDQNNPPISLQVLRKEYDKRAAINGLKPLSENPTIGGKHIEKLGNGIYRYTFNPKKAKIDLHSELKKFLAINNGICTLNEALAYAQSLNPEYKRSTVARYLKEIGWMPPKKKQKPTLSKEEVIRTCAFILRDKNVRLNINHELIPLFQKKTGKNGFNQTSFGNLLKKAKGVLFNFLGNGMIELCVPSNCVDSFDYSIFSHDPHQDRKSHPRLIRNAAVEHLLNAPGFKLTKKALFDMVIEDGLYPRGISKTNVYKHFKDNIFIDDGKRKGGSYTLNIDLYNKEHGFGDTFNWETLSTQIVQFVNDSRLDNSVVEKMYAIMQNVIIKPFDKSCEMWRILKLLDGYINGNVTDNESELLLYKLHIGLELYLKQYYNEQYSQDALSKYISSLQIRGALPSQNGNYAIGSIEHDISIQTGRMIKNRNHICHILNQGYNDPAFYNSNIRKALSYYLYVAAYALKH